MVPLTGQSKLHGVPAVVGQGTVPAVRKHVIQPTRLYLMRAPMIWKISLNNWPMPWKVVLRSFPKLSPPWLCPMVAVHIPFESVYPVAQVFPSVGVLRTRSALCIVGGGWSGLTIDS